MIFGSVPTHLRFGSCGSFSFTGSMTPRFVPVRVCRFVSVRVHTGNPCLGTCSWQPVLGNLFLGPFLDFLGSLAWEPVLGNLAWRAVLGTLLGGLSWEPVLGIL